MSGSGYGVALMLHVLSVVVWVGGMFFAYMVMRPTVVEVVEGPDRLRLFNGAFARFFRWVWVAVALVLISGYGMIGLAGGMAAVAPHIHMMHGLGLLMTALFIYVYFGPYRQLSAAVAAERWPDGPAPLNRIRQIIATNLVLGLVTVLVGASRGLL